MSNIKKYLLNENVEARFKKILGENANSHLTSVLNTVNDSKLLSKADPNTILTAAATAATLNLPIDKNLGYAWIVPYKGQAQFQMGWKGFVQLALRTNQYERINVVEVYENQFEFYNALTEDLKADFSIPGEGEVVGYAGYFRLVNSFEKLVYWTKNEIINHAKRFSKSYTSGPWKSDFDAMAKKTVVKLMLAKWGVTSLDMQKAQKSDQAVVDNEGEKYVDNTIDINEIENNEEESRALSFIEKATSIEEIEMVQEGYEGDSQKVSEAAKSKIEQLKSK